MNKEGNRRLKALLLGGVIVCLGACGGGGSSSGVSTLYVGTYAGVETTTYYSDRWPNGHQVTDSEGFVVSSNGKFLRVPPAVQGCERGGIQEIVISMTGNTGSYSFSGTCDGYDSFGSCNVEVTDVFVFSAQGATRTSEFSFRCESNSFWGTIQGVFQKVSG